MKTQTIALTFLAISMTAIGGEPIPTKPGIFVDPKSAGPDYAIQGEYLGDTDGQKWGVQIVASGGGRFDVHMLLGGLPGAGWNQKKRVKVEAVLNDKAALFTTKGWKGDISGGVIRCIDPIGQVFRFKKTARKSPKEGTKPPKDAIVLFDGKSAEHWANGKVVGNGLLLAGTRSKKPFGPGLYHVEFRTPFRPKARGQGRGNSGVYLMGREIQVLDSFGLSGEKNECGALYGRAKPAVNMCLPPLTWQTFDAELQTTKDNKLVVTVWHNGVKIHDRFPIGGANSQPRQINLQNHGNPVVYRNFWFVPGR